RPAVATRTPWAVPPRSPRTGVSARRSPLHFPTVPATPRGQRDGGGSGRTARREVFAAPADRGDEGMRTRRTHKAQDYRSRGPAHKSSHHRDRTPGPDGPTRHRTPGPVALRPDRNRTAAPVFPAVSHAVVHHGPPGCVIRRAVRH